MRVRATALLIGCSSGQLHAQGQFEATGIVHKFLLAGAPGLHKCSHLFQGQIADLSVLLLFNSGCREFVGRD
jgi:hypothetical protein